jgi:hypothetical protein
MKRLLTFLLILGLLAGCTVPAPEPEIVNPIECDGFYTIRFREWQTCGCPSCSTFQKGTYWVNSSDKRMFYLGDPVINPIEVFGKCPTEYIKEIFI